MQFAGFSKLIIHNNKKKCHLGVNCSRRFHADDLHTIGGLMKTLVNGMVKSGELCPL